jgi:hypothetical protein
MFRKHFRIRRLVLGLAFAAFAAPTAQAAGTFVDGGPVPVSRDTTSSQLSYLRYHNVGGPAAPAKVITPLQADGMRWQAMADAYRQQQASVAISERSFGVPGPDPSLVPQVVSATSNSFDWQDAGIGASTAFGVALLLVIAVAIMRRNQHSGLTNA